MSAFARASLLVLVPVLGAVGALALVACGGGESSGGAGACPAGTRAAENVCLAESSPDAERILEIVEGAMADNDLRAVLVGVRRGDEVLLEGGIGEATTGVPATGEEHFRAGNVSAGYLTTALLLLVEEGELSLDDPLSEWFPDLPRADRITVEMLANSTTGYEHFPNNPAFLRKLYEDPYQRWRAEQLIEFGVEDGTQFPPGTSWLFADTNLVILGQILEQVEGKPLGEIIAERILEPLELTETASPLTPVLRDPVLHGFTPERGVYEDASTWNPTWNLHSGSMSSSLGDMERWAQALGTGELLTPESFELQTGPSTVGKGPLTEDLYYSFGLGVSNGWIVTNPMLQGYTEILAYLPDQEMTVVLVTTTLPGADPEAHFATAIFREIAGFLTPEAVPELRG